MHLKCRGEVLWAGKHPACHTMVLSWSIPSCLPQPCAEVICELCLCQVLDLGLTWWGPFFLWPNLPWEEQQHCTSPWVQFPAPFHPRAVPARYSPSCFGYPLSSPVLLVQRAFKQLEETSPTCLHSENSAGTPMLALQPGTVVSTHLTLPAQWGAWLGCRELLVWRKIIETGTRENLWAEGETLQANRLV